MHRVLLKDENGHSLPHGIWLDNIFEDYSILIRIWTLQTTKNVLGMLNHVALPTLMGKVDTPLQRLRNALA